MTQFNDLLDLLPYFVCLFYVYIFLLNEQNFVFHWTLILYICFCDDQYLFMYSLVSLPSGKHNALNKVQSRFLFLCTHWPIPPYNCMRNVEWHENESKKTSVFILFRNSLLVFFQFVGITFLWYYKYLSWKQSKETVLLSIWLISTYLFIYFYLFFIYFYCYNINNEYPGVGRCVIIHCHNCVNESENDYLICILYCCNFDCML